VPRSIPVGAAVYSASALFAVRVRVPVVGVLVFPLCLDCGGMKNLSIGG
jgi:hypothetical protein